MLLFTNLLSFISPLHCDASYPWQIGFQDGATPNFEGIVELHDTIFFYLVVISFLVFWMLAVIMVKFSSSKVGIVHKYHNHGTLIELVWTITPALILIAIAFPSFKLLYLMDEVISPTMTVKVAGHQWYWSNNSLDTDNMCNYNNTSHTGLHEYVAVSSIIPTSPNSPTVDLRPLTTQDVPLVPSTNHDNTIVVLEQALASDLFSLEVRDFIASVRQTEYPSLCQLTPGGDLVIPEGISLGTKGQLPSLNLESGIYIIIQDGTDDGYIGSTIDYAVRLRSHRDLGASGKWADNFHLLYSRIYELGPNAFTFTPIQGGTNFLASFNNAHPLFDLSIKDLQLLEAFSKFELAIAEQAYLDHFKPTLNGRFIATTSTHPHLLSPISDPILPQVPALIELPVLDDTALDTITPQVDISNWVVDPTMKVQLLNIEGAPLGSFDSIRKAALAIDTNHQLLSRYSKSTDYVFNDYLDIEVDVHVRGVDKEGHVVHPGAKIHPPLVHDLTLSSGMISVLDSNLTTIVGSYVSMYAAAKWAGIRPIEIKRYIGTNYCVPTSLGSFYFDTDSTTLDGINSRGKHKSKPLDVVDLNSGTITSYSSVTKASKALKIHHDFINKHMVGKRIFTSLDGLRKYKFIAK